MPSEEILRELGAAPERPHAVTETRHLPARTSASNTVVHPNQLVTLSVDVSLAPRMHVYAPGVKGYIAIDWRMDTTPAAKVETPRFPKPAVMHLAAIGETVPVYASDFRLARDVVFGAVAPGEVILTGVLRYQACDDRTCYVPAEVPLRWVFRAEPLDRERVPEALRRK